MSEEQDAIAVARLVSEHYQYTFDSTIRLWQQRNQTFIYLLGTIALASFFTLRVTGADSLFIDLIAGLLSIDDANRINELRTSFPFNLLQTILLAAIFYLMVNLYHRDLAVFRNYKYLAKLETEIRQFLKLSDQNVAFTREGDFYSRNRTHPQDVVRVFYVTIIGLLLLFFVGGRIVEDIQSGELPFLLIDAIIALGTFYFYLALTFATSRIQYFTMPN